MSADKNVYEARKQRKAFGFAQFLDVLGRQPQTLARRIALAEVLGAPLALRASRRPPRGGRR